MAAAINKPKSDSRFVSVFADSTPDVDITFMVPFLQRPTDHYMCGVDDLTISLSALGILDDTERGDDAIILKVIRRRRNANADGPLQNVALDQFDDPTLGENAIFKQGVDTTILSLNEFIIELNRFGARIDAHIVKTGGLAGAEYIWTSPGTAALAGSKHLGFYLTPDGRLAIIGSKLFWSQFLLHIPNRKYQRILGINKEFLSLSASEGYEMGVSRSVQAFARLPALTLTANGNYNLNDFNNGDDDVAQLIIDWQPASTLWKDQAHIYICRNCLLSSLDRRVSIELGASLPMLNSPMVDHNQETPDFVLGRWMFPRNAESTITGGSSIHGTNPLVQITQKDVMGVITLQGAKDRVLYHTLRPQAKIQTVRLRLFARVRTYDAALDRWSMKTLAVPTNKTDWWHARLHFVSKD